jgi:hypothetical protein
MSLFDRIFGGKPTAAERSGIPPAPRGTPADEAALARYRYLLRTAPPETIEQGHAEAFAQLTPEQRRKVLEQLRRELPAYEQAVAAQGDDPQTLARMATRAELSRPGALDRAFGGMAQPGIGGMMAGSFLSTLAGVVVGSAIADHFFAESGYEAGGGETGDADQGGDLGIDDGYGGAESFGEDGGGLDLGGDFGGDIGGDL